MITQVVIPIATALIGAGVFQMFFKWLADRPKNKAHQNKVWEEFKTETLTTIKAEKLDLLNKVELLEYRHTLRDDIEAFLMDELEELGAPPARINRYREFSRQIRFAKTIEEAKMIRIRREDEAQS